MGLLWAQHCSMKKPRSALAFFFALPLSPLSLSLALSLSLSRRPEFPSDFKPPFSLPIPAHPASRPILLSNTLLLEGLSPNITSGQ